MRQVTFSEQSLQIVQQLSQMDQLKLIERLSSLSSDILSEQSTGISKFVRKGKIFHRIRLDDMRIYFEQVEKAFHCHYILEKNSLVDFLFRCNLPASDEAVVEKHGSFWDYLESLTKR